MMIAYLAQSNLSVSPEQFSHLIESSRTPLEDWDADREVKFWKEFHVLAQSISPATIETIEVNSYSANDTPQHKDLDRRLQKRRVVRQFSWVGLLSIFIVLAVQIYWIIGSNVVARVTEARAELVKLETKGKALNSEIMALDERLQRQKARVDDPDKDIDVRLMTSELNRLTGVDKQELEALKDTANEKINTLFATMRLTTIGLPKLFAQAGSEDHVYLEFQKILNAAAVEYFLPLLLGLLGACVYVLREIFHEIQEKTFLPEYAVGFRLRLYLGMIAGLTFAWLFAWVIPSDSEASGLGAASPLAIAFLVGYSVELLFSALDRVIASFSRTKTSKAPKKGAS